MTSSLIIYIAAGVVALIGAALVAAVKDARQAKDNFRHLQQRYDALHRCHMEELQNLRSIRKAADSMRQALQDMREDQGRPPRIQT